MTLESTTYLLVAAVILIVVLVARVSSLSRDMRGQAAALFEKWKQLECESIRTEEADWARREASVQLGQWKFDSERGIRRDAVTRSQAVTVGKVSEHIAPFLPSFSYNPKDARFIGSPVDFVVFDGLDADMVTQVVFIEVKSGSSALTARERQVRDAIQSKRVRWEELRVAYGNFSWRTSIHFCVAQSIGASTGATREFKEIE